MDIFTAIGEPTRRNIIEILAERGQLSAHEIYHMFKVSHPAISQHLKVLRESNLVQMEKHAQKHIFKINPNAITELHDWAERTNKLWNDRLNLLDKLLKEGERV